MTCTNTFNVDEWYSKGCIEIASTAGSDFFTDLFKSFYSESKRGIWVEGANEPPSSDWYDFQNLLIDLCNQVGKGKCKIPMEEICSSYDRSDTEHPTIRRFCGCYLNPSQYHSNLPRPCDTICSGFDNLRYFSSETSDNPETCETNVCVIDNITITAKGSEIGDITFEQICPYCAGVAGCRCIISDINIISRDSRLGALNIQQNCGGNTQCFKSVPGKGQVEVPCAEYVSSFGLSIPTIEQERERTLVLIITLAVVAFVILVLFAAAVVLSYRKTD